VELPSGTPSRSAAGPRRDDFNKLREGKVGVKWADRRCISAIPPYVRTRVRQLRQSCNTLDARNIPLTATEHQPAVMEEVRRPR
jgi:hypothetical protein